MQAQYSGPCIPGNMPSPAPDVLTEVWWSLPLKSPGNIRRDLGLDDKTIARLKEESYRATMNDCCRFRCIELLEYLRREFVEKGLDAYYEPYSGPCHNGTRWAIDDDEDLVWDLRIYQGVLTDSYHEEGVYSKGVIIKAPSLDFRDPKAVQDLTSVWDTLEGRRVPDLRVWVKCRSAVFCSLPGHDKFPLDLLKRVALAVRFFRPAIDDLLPDNTSPCHIIQPLWKRGFKLLGKHGSPFGMDSETALGDYWAALKSRETWEDLFLFFKREKNSTWLMLGPRKSTITFRHLPVSLKRDPLLYWPLFFQSFVSKVRAVHAQGLDDAQKGHTSFSEALGLRVEESDRRGSSEDHGTSATDTETCSRLLEDFIADPAVMQNLRTLRDDMEADFGTTTGEWRSRYWTPDPDCEHERSDGVCPELGACPVPDEDVIRSY